MRRRSLLSTGGTILASGCLRLSSEDETQSRDGGTSASGTGSGTSDGSGTGAITDYPLGLDEDGVNETLAQTHANRLADRSFVLDYEFEDNTDDGRYDAVSVRSEGDRTLLRRKMSPDADPKQYYYDGKDLWWRQVYEGDTWYGVQQPRSEWDPYEVRPQQLTFENELAAYIQLGAFEPPVEIEMGSNQGFKLVANEVDNPDALAGPGGLGDYSVDDVSAELLVDTDGIVRSFEGTFDALLDERQRLLEVNLDVSEIGETSVSTPDWLGEAREMAPELRLDVADDWRSFSITHEGGQTIPAGATVIVDHDTDDPEKTHSDRINDDLAAGETLHVWADGDGLKSSQGDRGVGGELQPNYHVQFHLDWGKYLATLLGDV